MKLILSFGHKTHFWTIFITLMNTLKMHFFVSVVSV